MGITKQKLLEREDLQADATSILVEVGALKECDNHPGIYFDLDEDKVTDAYKLANRRLTGKGATSRQRRESTDAIKDAYEGNSGNDGCEACRKNERD